MTARYITLGNGQRVTLAAYARAVRIAKAQPETEFKHGLTGWWPVSGAAVVRQFLAGVHDRINSHDPIRRGKWGTDQDRARHLRQLADRINSKVRVRADEVPLRWRERIAHRLSGACS